MKEERLVPAQYGDGEPIDETVIAMARSALATRRRRDRVFAPGLFAEPAWDMLLDLLIAEAENRRLSVSSTCLAAAVPQTTALRWLNYLVESGLLVRVQTGSEGRSTVVRLTPKARRQLVRTLAPAASAARDAFG